MAGEILKVLLIGDIVGKIGRQVTAEMLPQIREEYDLDFIIANSENAAGGFGLTPKIADALFSLGIDVLTSGNHIWNKKEIYQIIDSNDKILRPQNYPANVPGRGIGIYKIKDHKIAVLNLQGRVFLGELDCPFVSARESIKQIKQYTHNIIVDMHAEVTSEKVAMGWFLDGKVTAVVGTHTHIQTADERILPQGTGYLTDVGMTGPKDSVIGIKKDIILKRFLTQIPFRLEVARGSAQFCATYIEVDTSNGKCNKIERIWRNVG